ncbi:MAG: two-component system response regulator [Verrucomicrobia bacterium]|nr:MAG: two-component system response regulator [Verrucomicrobiota bacterium]
MPQKILMVDDDPLMHRLYKHHLDRAGYQMISAMNGREALDVADREQPNLIIMDVMMAEMDGITAVKELRKMESTKQIPVIVFTANANAYDTVKNESEFAGADVFMTKPMSPAQMVAEVKRLLPKEPQEGK